MKKTAITVCSTLLLTTLIAFCNYPNLRAVAKDSTENVTVQVVDTIPMMNGKYVSENWLRKRLIFHGVKHSHIEIFVLIAKEESTLDPSRVNRTLNKNKSFDTGLFQINSVHKKLYAKYDLLDPEENILAALELYKESGFRPWRSSIGSRAS